MSKLGPALRQQFVKGVKEVIKETAKEFLTARPQLSSVGSVSVSPPVSPTSTTVSPSTSPVPAKFPALCVCKYEQNAPDFGEGYRQYICSGCSKSGIGEYKTVVEGRKFAKLQGGRKTVRRSMRLHLTKRMRVRHNSKHGRSRR
jgi:hypothetical protein